MPTMLKDNARSPLRTISLGVLLSMRLPKREFLIAPWFRQAESAMIFAPPGVGKSMFALSLSLAVAGGGGILDWQAPKARKVLFVDGEMPLDDLRDSAALLLPSVEGNRQSATENLIFMARQHQCADAKFPDLATEDGRDEIMRKALEMDAQLVVLDNLSTLATIEDENAASSFNAPIAFLLQLKQAGLACILIHHSGKAGASYRGSSKIATTFEAIMGLESSKDPLKALDADRTTFRLSWNKFRGKKSKNSGVSMDITLTSPDGGEPRWLSEAASEQQIEVMLALLRSGDCADQKALAKAMGVTPGYISQLKKKAIALEIISATDWVNLIKRANQLEQLEENDALQRNGENQEPDF